MVECVLVFCFCFVFVFCYELDQSETLPNMLSDLRGETNSSLTREFRVSDSTRLEFFFYPESRIEFEFEFEVESSRV